MKLLCICDAKRKKYAHSPRKKKGCGPWQSEFDQQPVMNENNCDEKQQTFDDLLLQI
jgi:hypothetical protein